MMVCWFVYNKRLAIASLKVTHLRFTNWAGRLLLPIGFVVPAASGVPSGGVFDWLLLIGGIEEHGYHPRFQGA
jgi:hypothetical protein